MSRLLKQAIMFDTEKYTKETSMNYLKFKFKVKDFKYSSSSTRHIYDIYDENKFEKHTFKIIPLEDDNSILARVGFLKMEKKKLTINLRTPTDIKKINIDLE